MKAAVLHEVPGALQVEEVSIGKPGPREVLVRTACAGVCHSDLHFMQGLYPYPTPTVLGHESSGVVEAVGEGVTTVKPGDHVITCLSVYCGHCRYCLNGEMVLCTKTGLQRGPTDESRLTQDGQAVHQFLDLSSFAEQMLIHEHACVAIRPDMPLDAAALIGCAVTTGLGAVFRTARVEPGQTVAVIGCGGVGLNCVQGARIAGAGRIIAVDTSSEKLKLAEQFGATDLVDASATDAVGEVLQLSGGGVDHALEAIGLVATTEQAFTMLGRGGTATIIGMIPAGAKIQLFGHEFLRAKKIQGSVMGSNQFPVDMPRYIDLYLQGRLMLDELISKRRPLDEVNDAFADMQAGTVARTVLEIS